MNKFASYEEVLRKRQRELYLRVHKIENELDAPVNPDTQERATEREGDEVLEGIGQAGLSEIKAIDAALDRISAGTFGKCVRCGGDISEERLKLVPHAALCQNCMRPS